MKEKIDKEKLIIVLKSEMNNLVHSVMTSTDKDAALTYLGEWKGLDTVLNKIQEGKFDVPNTT